MKIEWIEEPVRFRLHGFQETVSPEPVAQVGLRLMDKMWRTVKSAGIPTTGINYWVYLPEGRMFVGVQLTNTEDLAADLLEPLDLELPRYLKHVHVGPYQSLPQKWQLLKEELATHGEHMGPDSLEVYGHFCEDLNLSETTILIGLLPKPNRPGASSKPA